MAREKWFRYDNKPSHVVATTILELYRKVIGKEDVTNKLVNITFAHIVVAQMVQKIKVN